MKIVDKRKKLTVPLIDVLPGVVFIDENDGLFMKIDLDPSCYPEHLKYSEQDAAVSLNDFEVIFFDCDTKVVLVDKVELVLS